MYLKTLDTNTFCNLQSEERSLRKQPSFRWASYKATRSPTRQDSSITHSESPHPSPLKSEYETQSSRSTQPPSYHSTTPYERNTPSRQASYGVSTPDSGGALPSQTSRQLTARPDPPNPPSNISTSSDNLKSFKVSLEDPAWKVLPAALKKYKINNDDWQNYAMFICYGQTGKFSAHQVSYRFSRKGVERCLSYDEKPLLLFQRLKDAKKNPVFMLKHIKDIRSPIAVAQQKQAARKASEASSSASRSTQSHSRSTSRPNKLNTSMHVNSSSNGQSSWPELMSPATEQKDKMDELGADANKLRAYTSNNGASTSSAAAAESEQAEGSSSTARQDTVATGVSYAVAIYPYMAEQEDEFDVVV